MRTEVEVKKRLAQVVWKYYKLRLTRDLSKRIENCHFASIRNLVGGLTPGSRQAGDEVRVFCVYQCKEGELSRSVCPFVGRVEECPVFALLKTKEQVKREVKEDLRRPLFKRHNMKDLVQLEWVLGLDEGLAGEFESQFLEEFLVFLERKHIRQGKWWFRWGRWVASWFRWGRKTEESLVESSSQ